MVNKDQVLAALQQHIGADNGITAAQLALQLGIDKRQVRHLITELRMEGRAVCGHPKSGYFMAATPADIEHTCQFLRSRAMHSLVLEARLRDTTLPDLLGQMRLKT